MIMFASKGDSVQIGEQYIPPDRNVFRCNLFENGKARNLRLPLKRMGKPA